MLTPIDASAVIDQLASVLCQPNTPLLVLGRQLQTNFIGDPPIQSSVALNVFLPPPAMGVRDRGIYARVVSCVHNGDGQPDAGDDRATAMAALPEMNLKPLKVTGFKFGP